MFMRGCVFGLALLGLVGCDQVSGGLAGFGLPADATNEGIRTLALLNGEVRVRGPEGYCVDQSASNSRRGFAVLAGCALLSDTAIVMPRLDGLITVQFGDEGTASVAGNENAFVAFLDTEAGRQLLSASGDASTLSDIAAVTDRSGVLVRFSDTSRPTFAGTNDAQWRGFMDVGGRFTTVSVRSFERNDLSQSEAERLLILAMTEIAHINAAAQPLDENT